MRLRIALVFFLFCGAASAQEDIDQFCKSFNEVTSDRFRDGMRNLSLNTKNDVNLAFIAENFEECAVRTADPDDIKVLCKTDSTMVMGPEETKQSLIELFGIYTEFASNCGLEFGPVEERSPSQSRYCLSAKGTHRQKNGLADVLYEGCSDDGEHWLRFIVSWP
jgi:hypothetical protein